jgi:hypothetical protein
MKTNYIFFVILLLSISLFAQNWQLKLYSSVYLRNWKLTTKIENNETHISGADIILYEYSGKIISQTKSNNLGEFMVMVPPNGEFYLTVSYSGCYTKRIAINTQGVPEEVSKDNFNPTFKIIGGFVMSKSYPKIDYSELRQDIIRVEYFSGKKAFDDNKASSNKGLKAISKIYSAEEELFNNFCSTLKAGDVALANFDCLLAKAENTKAQEIIPNEKYVADQLAKIDKCIKEKEEEAKKSKEEAKVKAEKLVAEKAATEKAEAERVAKAKAEEEARVKAAADAKGKSEVEKLAKNNLKDKDKNSETLVSGSENIKYKEAVENGDRQFGVRRYKDAKKYYEEALTYKGGDTYSKGKLIECERFINSDAIQTTDSRIKQLLDKYKPGITEESINGPGVVILQRVVVKDNYAWVYQKKIFNWGGVNYFRDGLSITESTFELETKP